MDEQKKEGKGNVCTCGCCGSHNGMMGMGCACGAHGGTRMLFRLLLVIIILILVFWFGVRLGELRESIRGYGGYGSYGYAPMRMMQGYGPMIPATGLPVTPNTTLPANGGSGEVTH
jgi:hypothetical protein